MAVVRVVIIVDDQTNTITVETFGPIKGKAGLCYVLKEALAIAKQSK